MPSESTAAREGLRYQPRTFGRASSASKTSRSQLLSDVGAEGFLRSLEAGANGAVVSSLDELGVTEPLLAEAPLDLFDVHVPHLPDGGVELVGVSRGVSVKDAVKLLLDLAEGTGTHRV